MPEEHPPKEVLARYARGELARAEGSELERHLSACLACQEALEAQPASPGSGVVRWRGHRFAGGAAFARDEPSEEPPLDPVRAEELRGVVRALGDILGSLDEIALRELLAASEHRRRAMIRSDPRFHAPSLCELLAARCREAWFDDPAGAVRLAKLAVSVAAHCSPEGRGGERADAVRRLAWIHLGNAYRIAASWETWVDRAAGALADGEPQVSGAAATLGEPPPPQLEAEAALVETRDALLARALPTEAALVVLDLATVLVKQGRGGEIPALASASLAAFAAAGAEGPGTTAVRALAERSGPTGERVTLPLLAELAQPLARHRSLPV